MPTLIDIDVLLETAIKTNYGPECGDELDTGLECTECGVDAAKERDEYLRFVKDR